MMEYRKTRFGKIGIEEENGFVTRLILNPDSAEESGHGSPLLENAFQQLNEYFLQKRKIFTIPLNPHGTAFQRKVWTELQKIDYGVTVSYGEIAGRIGNAGAARAVGMANNRNPIPIFIPCHRVIGADGSLVGYGAGLHWKKTLLSLENRMNSCIFPPS